MFGARFDDENKGECVSRVKKLARRRANAKFERNMRRRFFINLKHVSYDIEYNWKQKRMALKALGDF